MLYRIITQHKNYVEVMNLLKLHFDGFTMYRGTGVYTNEVGTTIESALIIEIDTVGTGRYLGNDINAVIKSIKEMNAQECILLQKIQFESELI